MTASYASQTDLLNFIGYDSSTSPFSTTQLQDALNRAEAEINKRTSTVFVDGTLATPNYTQVTNEKHDGKGAYDKSYYTRKYPIPDVSTTVSGTSAVTADDTTVWVASTNGFPSSGVFLLGTDKVTYTGKTTEAFTGCTGVDSSHLVSTDVKSYVIELSTSDAGSVPTWRVLAENTEFDIEFDTGRVHVYRDNCYLDTYGGNSPQRIPNRVRINYLTGYDEIPYEITRLCCMIASKELLHAVVRKAYSDGMNDFNPELINIDEDWIEKTVAEYKSVKFSNI